MTIFIFLPAPARTGIVPPDLRPHLDRLLFYRDRRIMIIAALFRYSPLRQRTDSRCADSRPGPCRRQLILPYSQLAHIRPLLTPFPDLRMVVMTRVDPA